MPGSAPNSGMLLRKLGRLADRHWRSVLWLRLRPPPGLFQPVGDTLADRYPVLFRIVHDTIGDGPDRALLSFGCSTGEEIWSLRQVFPQARLRGLDINATSIALAEAARHRRGDDGVSFATAASAVAEPVGRFDAVFAMAVFRHGLLGGGPPRCDRYLRFDAFERTVTTLAQRIRPGGLLIIRHANFRFEDTAASAAFDCMLRQPYRARTPVYGRDNRRLAETGEEGVIFLRHVAGDAANRDDL